VKKKDDLNIGEYNFLDGLDGLSKGAADKTDALDGLGIDGGGDDVKHFKNVKYTGKAEHDTRAELTATQQTFRIARKRETAQREEIMDVGFYFCVIFENSEQKAEFLKKLNVSMDVDERTMFVSGFKLAKKLGIQMKSPRVKWSVSRNDSSWANELGII
jgi:hypothetical protein